MSSKDIKVSSFFDDDYHKGSKKLFIKIEKEKEVIKNAHINIKGTFMKKTKKNGFTK